MLISVDTNSGAHRKARHGGGARKMTWLPHAWEAPTKGPCWDFPGGRVAKTECFQSRGPMFDPWSGN